MACERILLLVGVLDLLLISSGCRPSARATAPGTSPGAALPTASPVTHEEEAAPPPSTAPLDTGRIYTFDDTAVAHIPRSIDVPQVTCPGLLERGAAGTVVLRVRVLRDGSVAEVEVTRGYDHECDEVAADALRRAQFEPAALTDGTAVAFDLRYDYEFRLQP